MMEFLGLKKKKVELTGQLLIEGVIDKFSVLIDQLEKGVEECRIEQNMIAGQIASLEVRNSSLMNSVRIGVTLSNQLADLMK